MAYSYDLHGNVIGTETVNADQTQALIETRLYDNRNRLIETRLPHNLNDDSVIQRILDENSNLVGLVDPNGATAANAYDPSNRLAENTHRLNVVAYKSSSRDNGHPSKGRAHRGMNARGNAGKWGQAFHFA